MPIAHFKSYETLKEGNHRLVSDLFFEKYYSESDFEMLGQQTRSYLVIPIFVEEELVGSMNMSSNKPNAFTELDVQMLGEIGAEIGISMTHQKLKAELEEKNRVIAQKNKDMTDSIRYAKRIQDAFFPTDAFNSIRILNESFVYFQPKDIVSGDFFWVQHNNDYTYFAVADCTGHGVPGAFMSIVGFNWLDQAVKEMDLEDTDDILDFMHNAHRDTFKSDAYREDVNDGMAISLCRLNQKTGELQFSGANQDLYLFTKGELKCYKGKRSSIGDNMRREVSFNRYEITAQKGDTIYLFTDGYTDQFGGKHQRKFMYDRFQDLLLSIRPLDMRKQKEILQETFLKWKGKIEQVDDVCVIGVRV